jgi:hypothetical protein
MEGTGEVQVERRHGGEGSARQQGAAGQRCKNVQLDA